MKKFSLVQKSFFYLLALSLFTFTACESDPDPGPGGGGVSIPPAVNLADNGISSILTDATVAPGEIFVLNVTASEGDNPLKSLTVTEDGTTIDAARLNGYEGVNNPALLVGDNATSIDWDIPITAHTDPGIRTYRVTIEDTAGETNSVSVDITVTSAPPTFTYAGSADITAERNSLVSINISATTGGSQLSTLSVSEDGVLVDASRLSFQGTQLDANPYLLVAPDVDGFDMGSLVIRTVDVAGVTNSYTVEIADVSGNTESVVFNITTNPDGTAITKDIPGVLWNSAGPAGFGGIDLTTGETTGSTGANTHIHDEGIDFALPAATNWRQRISGEKNGSVVKLIDPAALPEGFSFANVAFKEEIAGAHANGIGFQNMNTDGELISWVVEEGDLYTVEHAASGITFLIEIVEVNIEPSDDPLIANDDNYKINIKF